MIKNSYKRQLTIPCGGIKKNEDKKTTATRELFEETGIKIKESELNFFRSYINNSEYKHDVAFLFEVFLDNDVHLEIDNREVIFAEFMSIHKVLETELFPIVKNYLLAK